MNAHRTLLLPFIILGALHIAIAGRGTVQETRVFSDRPFQHVLREASEFLGNLTAAKTATAAADAKLNELKAALTKGGSGKSSAAILLPSGWDKKSIVDAITKALSQSKQLQELSDKFDRFVAEIKTLEEVIGQNPQIWDKAVELALSKNKARIPGLQLPSNLSFGNLSSLDNTSLSGKLVGFIKTGRHLGSFQVSELNPCSKGGCDKWKKGLESLRDFLSKTSSKIGDFFKNTAALRSLSEEAATPIKIDSHKIKVVNKTKTINSSAIEQEVTKKPIDYFDYYYNGEELPNQKQQPSTPSAHRDPKIAMSSKNVNISSSNNVLTGAQKVSDYFDYYYSQGIPALISNRTKFVGGKIGG